MTKQTWPPVTPKLTVDAVIRTPEGVVLIKRKNPPIGWALPGGFVDVGETVDEAVIREAREETEDRKKELLRAAAMARAFNIEMYEISLKEAGDLVPGMSTAELVAAFYLPKDGVTNPIERVSPDVFRHLVFRPPSAPSFAVPFQAFVVRLGNVDRSKLDSQAVVAKQRARVEVVIGQENFVRFDLRDAQ